MDDKEFEILSAKAREIMEMGRIPEPGSPEADIMKRYDTFLAGARRQLSEYIQDTKGELPNGINDIVRREYVKTVKNILEEGRTPSPDSYEAKVLANFDEILKNEQDTIASFDSKNKSEEIDDSLEALPSPNKNMYVEDGLTSNKQIYRPSLLERIKVKLSGVKDKIDKTIQREFRYRQFRRFKDYTFGDYFDEIVNRHRMNDQRRSVERQTSIINNIEQTPENEEYIEKLKSARDAAQRRLEAIRTTMKGQRGFAFIEEENGIKKDIPKEEKTQKGETTQNLSDPNYLKMIAGRGEGLGQFRTNYRIVSRSQTRHAISATAYAAIFAIVFVAMDYTMGNLDPAFLDPANITNGMSGISGLINRLLPIAKEGIDKLRSINTTTDINEIMNNAPAQLVMEAGALALSTIGLIRQTILARRARFQRRELEDQNYLNIGNDVDDVARRM